MVITSLSYLGFFLAVLVMYYILPTKLRWSYLLIVSIVYLGLSGKAILVLYPVISVMIAWICTNAMEKVQYRKLLLYISLAGNLGVLVVLKYLNLGIYTYNALGEIIGYDFIPLQTFKFLAPVGVSFYTMSILGYIFDVYYDISKPEKNYFKLLLFGVYFPLLISGPIVRYKDSKTDLFGQHELDYNNITHGCQRILIGFFKVLVISERLAILVQTVYGNYKEYPGMYVVIATFAFTLRLYTNFSGSMDIVLGVSQTLGIILPENFRQPFFSKTIQEFWQRWHITLGAWLKDYILYPVLRTKFFMELPKRWKDRLGKKKAKQYTTFIALFILWNVSGLWHGGAWKYIWGTGILQCIYIIVSELSKTSTDKLKTKLNINDNARGYILFQRIRTFVLISVGFLFFNANSLSEGFRMLGSVFTTWNLDTLVDGSLLELGLNIKDWCVLVIALVALVWMSCLNEKKDIRDIVAEKSLILRWGIWFVLLFIVILGGSYGPGYSAAEFIYQGF